jgi:non-heme chloroperoxidase
MSINAGAPSDRGRCRRERWRRLRGLAVALNVFWCATAARAQPLLWHDPSPHTVRFVTVDADVRLEVLDWGGSGPALVLLHGSGTTAHNFDEFAPKLRARFHVYAITRRGHGQSSKVLTGYSEQRLADDVLAVIDALRARTPILAGHSMAGGELTVLGRQHSDRLGGLIYLSALRDPRDDPQTDPRFDALLKKTPPPLVDAPEPRGANRTVANYRNWQMTAMGFQFPESDLRNAFDVDAQGTMTQHVSPPGIFYAIGEAQQRRDYSGIRVPVLVIDEGPRRKYNREIDRFRIRDAGDIAAAEAFGGLIADYIERWQANVRKSVGDVRFVDLPGAGHYLFMTREREVLDAITAFADHIARAAGR